VTTFILKTACSCLLLYITACVCGVRDNARIQTHRQTHWSETFDFDGDRINDKVIYKFTGGAHCCYLVSVLLSSDRMLYEFPFEMDGGYEGGLDLSKPEHFNIRDYDDDGLPEIFMEINTYNSERYEIPLEWREEYGIYTNYIVIDYISETLRVSDFTPDY
jgi:hypothetical protein